MCLTNKILGREVKAFLAALLFILVTVPVAWSLTRTISDTQDTASTFITNSRGRYWEASGDNIQLAIDDLNETNGGHVWLPAGSFLINESIETGNLSVTIEGQGWGVTAVPTTNEVTEIKINKYVPGGFNDYAVKIGTDSDVSMGTSIRNLVIDGADSVNSSGGILMENCQYCKIEDVMVDDFFAESPPSVGINITANGIGSYYNVLDNVMVRRCTIGVNFGYNSNANSFLSGMVSNGRNLAGDYPMGIRFYDSDTNSVYGVDVEGHDNGTGIVMETDDGRSCSLHKFFGTRFEGNDRDVLIKSGNTGYHRFYGCSASNTISATVTDNSSHPSYFRDFYGYDVFYLDDVLHLKPASSAPASPEEGMLFANSTDHRLYYYNGTGWAALH